MKSIYFLSISLFLSISIFAQTEKAIISFDNPIHDFEILKEEQGSVTHSFVFTNTGSSPLIISNIKTAYGCNVYDLNTEPVLPGKKGSINIKYQFAGKPGIFNKQIRITSNSETPNTFLTMKGEVRPKGITPDQIFKVKIDQLGLTTNMISITKVYTDQTAEKSIQIYNFSDENMTVTFYKFPEHITIKTQPEVLKPNTEGKIVLTYNASIKNDIGYLFDNAFVLINGVKPKESNRLTITANIQHDFSNLTAEELAKAPKIDFEKTEIDFGTTNNQQKDMKLEYKFTNTGKSPLIIHKVNADCGCTAVQQVLAPIVPGQSSSIIATFDTRGRKGKQHKTITIISNDPENHTIKLQFTGIIEMN